MEFIVFRTPKGQIKKVFLDGCSLHRYDEAFLLEAKCIAPGATVNVLPLGVLFYLCERIEEEVIVVRGPEVYVERIGDNAVRVLFEDVNRRQEYEDQFGLRFTKEVKREVLRKWKGVRINEEEGWQDDGETIALFYEREFTGTDLTELLEEIYAFDEDINRVTRERMIQIVTPIHLEQTKPYLKKKWITKPAGMKQVDFL